MSRIFTNLYNNKNNNIEFFEDTDNQNTGSDQSTDQASDSQNIASERQDDGSDAGSSDAGTDRQNSGIKIPPVRTDVQSLDDVKKEDINDTTLDEIDDEPAKGEEDVDPVKSEMDDLFEDDQQDDEVLSEDDIDNIIDDMGSANQNEEKDEVDIDVYKPPVIPEDAGKNDPDNDVKLGDMDIDDADSDDNLLKQGGTKGEKALEMVSQMGREGDELADLILEVPITFITLMIETILKIIGAIFEGPISSIDSFLEPIRDALKGLYSILRPIVVLLNYIIALPLSIGIFAWSTLCNIMKILGLGPGQCKKNYKPNDDIIVFFDLISNINPFRFRDLFFSEEFRNNIFGAIKMLFMKIKEAFVLIVKIINIVTKIIEYLINKMTEVIKITEEVTQKSNLQGFFAICIILGVFYLTFFGLKHAIDLSASIKDKFFS